MNPLILIVVAGLILLAVPPGYAQTAEPEPGKIEKFEKALQDTTKRETKHESRDEYMHRDDDEAEDFAEVVSEYVVIGVFGLVGYLPGEEEPFYENRRTLFPRYPYVVKDAGIYCLEDSAITGKPFAVIVSADYFHQDEHLDGGETTIRIFPYPIFDFTFNYTELIEDVSYGKDRIVLNSYLVNYRRLRLPGFNFYWGMGVKTIRGNRYYRGLAADAGLELFPAKPLSLSYNYTASDIRNALVSEHLARVRGHYKKLAGYIGYRTLQTGRQGIDGMIVGWEGYF
jgi:hypothetical protein